MLLKQKLLFAMLLTALHTQKKGKCAQSISYSRTGLQITLALRLHRLFTCRHTPQYRWLLDSVPPSFAYLSKNRNHVILEKNYKYLVFTYLYLCLHLTVQVKTCIRIKNKKTVAVEEVNCTMLVRCLINNIGYKTLTLCCTSSGRDLRTCSCSR